MQRSPSDRFRRGSTGVVRKRADGALYGGVQVPPGQLLTGNGLQGVVGANSLCTSQGDAEG